MPISGLARLTRQLGKPSKPSIHIWLSLNTIYFRNELFRFGDWLGDKTISNKPSYYASVWLELMIDIRGVGGVGLGGRGTKKIISSDKSSSRIKLRLHAKFQLSMLCFGSNLDLLLWTWNWSKPNNKLGQSCANHRLSLDACSTHWVPASYCLFLSLCSWVE